MTAVECGNCGRPSHDGAKLCLTCTGELRKALLSCPGLLDDLLTTLAKQDRLGTAGGKRGTGSEQPLPVRLDIGPVITALGNTLTTWARDLVELHSLDVPDPPRRSPYPELDVVSYAAVWLADHAELLRAHPACVEAHRGITDALAAAQRAVDRPPPLVYRGPCEKCAAQGIHVDLHAAPNAATVKCDRCRQTYDGAQLRARLLDEAADQLVTAVDLSAALTGLSGVLLPIGTIRSWRSRGQLIPHAWLHDGRVVGRPLTDRDKALYRVGDAVKLLDSARVS